MKTKCYISFVAFAVAVMLTAAFLPHHHHDGMLCTHVEYCEYDGRYNDEHTGHTPDHTRCLDDTSYIHTKRSISTDDSRLQLQPLYIIAWHMLPGHNHDLPVAYHRQYYRQPQYKSADVCPANIHRGPPSLFI